MYETIGHPEKDKELFREISPVFHADKIVAPLFIAQGANDPRVKKAESDQMVEAMKARDCPGPVYGQGRRGGMGSTTRKTASTSTGPWRDSSLNTLS